jgi:hypothetical protein
MAVLFVSCGFAFGQGLNDGLVAYYPFNGNANDESGNGNNGVTSSAVLTTDRFDQENSAYFFDGNDFVSMGNPPSLRLSGDFTISSWALFTTNVGTDRILSFNQEFGYELGIWDGNPWFAYARKNHRASQVLQPNTWFNLTVTKAGSLIRIYLNGEKILEESNNGNPTFSRELRFGEKSQQNSWWSGKIDDTRLYNRSFTQGEVNALLTKSPQFQIIEGNFTWQEAKADAEAKGGQLAVLDTQEKIDAANSYLEELGERPHLWIGLTDEEEEGNWKWVDGTSLEINNWSDGEPNNSWFDRTPENYVIIASSSARRGITWNDVPGGSSLGWNGSSTGSYLLEILDQTAAAPFVAIDPLYESPTGESITLDATPTLGFPTEFTYQWCFNGFKIPANLGGTASSINIDSLQANEGTWSVTVTNSEGIFEKDFEYRLYSDSDSDGLSDAFEELISETDIDKEDTDNDGLSDAEEFNTYRTNPNSPDSDSDGFTDLYELETAYDPNSAESVPDALVNIMTAIEVKFNAALGATYAIEFSTDNQNWDVIEDDIVGEGGAVERLYSKQNFPTGFFRVERRDQ